MTASNSIAHPLAALAAAIPEPDPAVAAAVRADLDRKTKPPGSLGRLEEICVRYAAQRGDQRPPLPAKAVVVMAGDHGVAASGVSPYPQAVTAQMVRNFAAGGAAINVLARRHGAEVVVVDMGVAGDLDGVAGVRRRAVGPGTADFQAGPAMAPGQAGRALATGAEVAAELVAAGTTLIGLGEMGIGNTTSAAALAAAYLGLPAAKVTGRGTGVDDAGLVRKTAVVEAAVNRHGQGDPAAVEVLARLGGFEIAGLAGVAIGAAAARVPVVLDGFISSVAGLAAVRLAPKTAAYLWAGHRSVEPGHGHVLGALGLEPLLELDMRLGEGTGACLAMGLVDAAVAVLHEMATFDEAGVSERQ